MIIITSEMKLSNLELLLHVEIIIMIKIIIEIWGDHHETYNVYSVLTFDIWMKKSQPKILHNQYSPRVLCSRITHFPTGLVDIICWQFKHSLQSLVLICKT